MPAWAGLMPTAIKAQLSIVWSYTYDQASDLFTGRLAGNRVAIIFGRNFHGLSMSEAYPKSDYPSLFAKCKRILGEPALYHGRRLKFHSSGKLGEGERIIMPLSSDGIAGDGVFGATDVPPSFGDEIPEIDFDGEIVRWFSTSGVAITA